MAELEFEVDGITYKHPRLVDDSVRMHYAFGVPSTHHYRVQPMIALKDDTTFDETEYSPAFAEGDVCDKCWLIDQSISPIDSVFCPHGEGGENDSKSEEKMQRPELSEILPLPLPSTRVG